MSDIVIIGAGGAGREIYCWIEAIRNPAWRLAGFLDSTASPLAGKYINAPILGDPATFHPHPNQLFVCSLGDTSARRRLCALLEDQGAGFAIVQHPTAIASPGAALGPGCILSPQALAGPDATLGSHIYINVGASVHHDAQVGDWSFIGPHASVLGGVTLGRGVFIGANACVLPRVTIGDFATIGAGSVVTRDVAPGATVSGVPARPKKGVPDSQVHTP